MPAPIILGLGAAAAALGIGGHLSAKETNEKAQALAEKAQALYDAEKQKLEEAQKQTETDLSQLGYSKKAVLEGTIKRFLQVYSRIKNIEFNKNTVGLTELSRFTISQEQTLQLQEMTNIYEKAFSNGAAGAAAGAAIALAANGTLAFMAGDLAIAGSALMAGQIGVATGIAGGALSMGLAMTPLAAIAAPVVLFTGISSSFKADENLEKAKTMYAEAEAAAEKMKISETLCTAISDRSKMFDSLLHELDDMFRDCTVLLEVMIYKKTGIFKGKVVDANSLTEEELELIAVTRSLAGAVKAVIDTPILSKDGNLSVESQKTYDRTQKALPQFAETVKTVKSHNYNNAPLVKLVSGVSREMAVKEYGPDFPVQILSWIISVWIIFRGIIIIPSGTLMAGVIWVAGGLIMCPKVNKKMKFFPKLFLMFLVLIIGRLFA